MFVCIQSFAQSPVIKVDFNQSGRTEDEVNEPGFTSWFVTSTTSLSSTLSGVTFTFTSTSNGTGLKSNWYKTNVQAPYYARLANDVMTTDGGEAGGEITMTISGLATGTHSLLFYLNNVDNPANNTFPPLDIFINGTQVANDVQPTVRVENNSDAKVSYHTFSATSGSNVVVKIKAETSSSASNKNVNISGFELNTPNATKQSKNPVPGDGDNHANLSGGSGTLSWTAASDATAHRVYFGTSQSEIDAATTSSSTYKGEQTSTSYNVSGLNNLVTYYWRVDEKDGSGVITKGNTWSFKVRQLSFPDAEGYGAYALGGRGGKVVYVTNLNDSGTGSFRAAATSGDGPRTIVFNVSGVIALQSRLNIDDNVTVAGQTAPGKGICFRAAPIGIGNESVFRFIRMRLGAGATYDGIGMAGANNSIMDHCSISWTIDESFSSRGAKNITLQRTLVSEALNVAGHQNYPAGTAHGYAGSVGGDVASLHHNLLAHNEGRNWSMAGGLDGSGYYAGRLDIFNTVVYNWGGRTTDGGAHEVNFVNNYYKAGAASTKFNMLTADLEGAGLGTQSYYTKGNILQLANGSISCDGTNDACGRAYTISGGQVLDWTLWPTSPFFASNATIQSARAAYKSVLSDVGCISPVLDDHDKRMINETLNGTYTYSGSVSGKPGLPDNESDVGGFESYPSVTRASNWDSDLDGMPDWWETLKGLNPNSGSGNFTESNADADGNGYTNLEEYLNWMANINYSITYGQTVQITLTDLFKGYTSSPSYTTSNALNCTASISGGTITITPQGCGLASVDVKVTDSQGDNMTRRIGVYVSGTCPTGGSLIIQENATGFCSVDGTVDSNNAGYTGSGFANTTNATGAGIDYQVVIGTSGTYNLTIGYASTSDRPANIMVDGATVLSNVSFPSTGSWTTWSSISQSLSLTAGTHNIRLEATSSSGLGNIDYLQIAGSNVSAGSCTQATYYNLTVSTSGSGTVSQSSGSFAAGTVLSLTATPSSGYLFTGWSGDASGTSNPLSLTMNANKNITANFSAVSNPAEIIKHGAGSSSQTIGLGEAIVDFYFNWTNATTVTVTGMPAGITTTIDNNALAVSFSGTPTQVGTFNYTITTVGGNPNATRTGTITVNGSSSAITIQENETGFCGVDGTVDSNNTGFTGSGFANTSNAMGTSISWSVNVPSSGSYNLMWRLANGGSTDRPGNLIINGNTVGSVSLPSTGSWTTWSNSATSSVSLTSGINTIELEATTASGLANIDYIEVTGIQPAANSCGSGSRVSSGSDMLEAEDQELFAAYPNPVRIGESMKVKLPEGSSKLEIISMSGALVGSFDTNAQAYMDVNVEFEAGVYIVQISGKEGLLGKIKLIVQ